MSFFCQSCYLFASTGNWNFMNSKTKFILINSMGFIRTEDWDGECKTRNIHDINKLDNSWNITYIIHEQAHPHKLCDYEKILTKL